jgi:hypothetical protein
LSEMITIEISETTARIVREIAARTGRDPGTVLSELVDRSISEVPVEALPDDQVLALSDMTMSDFEQNELSDLLAAQREGQLDEARRARLDELMQVYRRGLVRKSEALRVAVHVVYARLWANPKCCRTDAASLHSHRR